MIIHRQPPANLIFKKIVCRNVFLWHRIDLNYMTFLIFLAV